MPAFLKSATALMVTGLLVLQGGLLYSYIRPENIPTGRSLSEMPKALGSWEMAAEGVIDPEIQEALKADDILNRTYLDRSAGRGADLYVASYHTQRTGKAPHSPKNCLPGNGWTPLTAEEVTLYPGT